MGIRQFSSLVRLRAVISAVFAMYCPRSVAGTKGDSAMSIFSTLNISVARIKRWRIWAHLSNVGDTAKMVPDEVVALAALQLSRAVVADGMAVSKSIYTAYSP